MGVMNKKYQGLEMRASQIRWTLLAILVLVAAISRVIQPYPNFTAIGALAVISAMVAPRAVYAFLLTWGALLLGDVLLSQFRDSTGWSPAISSYLGWGLVVGLGLVVRSRPAFWKTALASLLGGLAFFVFSNGAVWLKSAMSGGAYSADLAGLLECYTLAIPFYRTMLMGDFIYVPLFYIAMIGALALEGLAARDLARQES
jgi:hypothetical protein